MQLTRSLILVALLYISSASASALAFSARSELVCRVEGESCSGSPDCCATFYCASRGVVPEDNKCHRDGICGGGGAPCKANSHCCSGTCDNNKCTQEQEPDGP